MLIIKHLSLLNKENIFFLLLYEKKLVTLHHENKANHNKDYSVVKTSRAGILQDSLPFLI